MVEPDDALHQWGKTHKAALQARGISKPRHLLTGWSEIALDETERTVLQDEMWARAHGTIANALWETPIAPRHPVLAAAIQHYLSALRVYTEADYPEQWAMTQNNLGNALEALSEYVDDRRFLGEARNAFAAAARGYESVGMRGKSEECFAKLREIDATLSSQAPPQLKSARKF